MTEKIQQKLDEIVILKSEQSKWQSYEVECALIILMMECCLFAWNSVCFFFSYMCMCVLVYTLLAFSICCVDQNPCVGVCVCVFKCKYIYKYK